MTNSSIKGFYYKRHGQGTGAAQSIHEEDACRSPFSMAYAATGRTYCPATTQGEQYQEKENGI